MAGVAANGMDAEHAASLGRRYLIRFEEDTLWPRPLWIRLMIEFLGTFVLVTVAAGAGVINHHAGSNPISRTAALIGAVVIPMIYAWAAIRAAYQPGRDVRLHRPGVVSAGLGGALLGSATARASRPVPSCS